MRAKPCGPQRGAPGLTRLGNALGLVPCRGIVQPIERKPTDHGDAQAYQCVGPKPQRSNEELRHARYGHRGKEDQCQRDEVNS